MMLMIPSLVVLSVLMVIFVSKVTAPVNVTLLPNTSAVKIFPPKLMVEPVITKSSTLLIPSTLVLAVPEVTVKS